jgi:hypothetical protein
MGTLTHSAFTVDHSLFARTLPRTIATHRNEIIHSHDELFADLLESNCDIPG